MSHRLIQDLELTWRRLRRRPGFAVAALATIAIGLGANVAVFSLVEAVLLTPPPYHEPGRLVVLYEQDLEKDQDRVPVAATTWQTWREASATFSSVAAYSSEDFVLLGDDGDDERLRGARVSADLFELLGVRPERGRGFEALEDRSGGARAVVVSHGLWQRRLGGADDVLGTRLSFEEGPATVVGVMPAGFAFPTAVDVWAPIGPEIDARQWMRGMRWLGVVARLADGVARETLDDRLSELDRRLVELHPDVSTGYRSRYVRLADEATGGVRQTLWLLQVAVLLVLGVVVANLANLLSTQAIERRRELAVRMALGAGRGQILRQLLTENAALVISGGFGGLLLGVALVGLLARLGPRRLTQASPGLDPLAVILAIALMMLVALALAGATTLFVLRRDLAHSLRGSGLGSGLGTGQSGRLRSLLVAVEVAAALVLLIGALAAVQGYLQLSRVDPGFETDDAVVVRLALSRTQFPSRSQRSEVVEQLASRLAGLASEGRVSLASQVPLVGAIPSFEVRARDRDGDPGDIVSASYQAVDDRYFRTLGIPVLAGRSFDPRDHASATETAILSASLARQLFGSLDPVGRSIVLEIGLASELEVVGVVPDVRQQALGEGPRAALYVPLRQSSSRNLTLVLRTEPGQAAGRGLGLVDLIEQEIGGRPVLSVTTLDSVLAAHLASVRLGSLPLLAFSGIALLLGLVGVHGVVGFTVVQRRREIALRLALGAERREVILGVLGSALRPVAIGVVVGWGGAWALRGLLERWLADTGGQADPRVALGAALIFCLGAFVAAWAPTRNAASIEPMQILREDG